MAVDVRAVDIGCHVTVKNQAHAFLQEKKDASASTTSVRVLSAFTLAPGIEDLQTRGKKMKT